MLSDRWREPHRLHPLSPIVAVARNPLGFGFAAVLAIATGDAVFLLAVIVIAGGAVVAYFRQRWWFDGATLHLRTGLIAIQERSLSLDRVQQVDLREPLVARMLGLAVVSVESASGSAGSDIELHTLSIDEARQLRRAILSARTSASAGTSSPSPEEPAPGWEPDEPEPLATLPLGELVLAGLIGAESLGYGAAAAASAGGLALETVVSNPDDLGAGPAIAVVLFVGFLAFAVIAAVASMVLGYAELRLTAHHGEIRLRRGLLDRREESTPVQRVQVISVTETPPQRALSRVAIRLRAAGTPGKESAGRLRLPIWHRADTPRLLDALVPGTGHAIDADLRPAPSAARRRAVVRRALALSPLAVVLLVVSVAASWWFTIPAVGVLAIAAPWGLAAYRALGLARSGGVVISRKGAVIRRTDLAPETKVQSTRVQSTPFQRRLGLATLFIDVAATGAVRVPDRAASEALALGAELGRSPT